MRFGTQEAVDRYNFELGRYKLIVSMDPDHANLERLNNGAPLLANHNKYDLSGVIGVVEPGSAKLGSGQGFATVRFSERPEAQELFKDVEDGIIRNVSMGVAVEKLEEVTKEGDEVRTFKAVKHTIDELSLVPVGADSGAQVLAHEPLLLTECEVVQTRKAPSMETKTVEKDAEAQRRETIFDLVNLAGGSDTQARHLILQNLSVEEVHDWCREFARKKYEEEPGTEIRSYVDMCGGSVRMGDDLAGGPGTKLEAMAEGLAARAGVPPSSGHGRHYAQMSTLDMAREIATDRGYHTDVSRGRWASMWPGNSHKNRLYELSFHSTSDFPIVMANAGSRILRDAYDAAPGAVLSTGRKVTTPDFRPRRSIQMSEGPDLQKVNEHGEFTRGTVEENEESYKVETWGRVFSFTRQLFINDDIGAFADFARKHGQSAAETERQVVVDLLALNSGTGPTMSNGNPLFHSANGNLAGSGSVIDETSLSEARLAMRMQKGLTGRPINAAPRFLLVPAALETTAEKFLATLQPNSPSDVNPFANALELLVDPRLDVISTTAWYLVADSNSVDGLEYAHLDGSQGPEVDTRQGFDIDGVEIRVRLDFGAGFVDHRGWYLNPGA